MSIWTCLFTFFLGGIALLGDYTTQRQFHGRLFLKAFIDNGIHFLIAFFSWLIVCDSTHFTDKKLFLQATACGVIASIIDIDHFIAAKSLQLHDATNLHRRPFLHCSTIFLVLFSAFYIIAKVYRSPVWYDLSWLLLTSSATHHLRDGYRRGLWLYPFKSIPPYPYSVYIILTLVLPFTLKFPRTAFKIPSKNTILLI